MKVLSAYNYCHYHWILDKFLSYNLWMLVYYFPWLMRTLLINVITRNYHNVADAGLPFMSHVYNIVTPRKVVYSRWNCEFPSRIVSFVYAVLTFPYFPRWSISIICTILVFRNTQNWRLCVSANKFSMVKVKWNIRGNFLVNSLRAIIITHTCKISLATPWWTPKCLLSSNHSSH